MSTLKAVFKIVFDSISQTNKLLRQNAAYPSCERMEVLFKGLANDDLDLVESTIRSYPGRDRNADNGSAIVLGYMNLYSGLISVAENWNHAYRIELIMEFCVAGNVSDALKQLAFFKAMDPVTGAIREVESAT